MSRNVPIFLFMIVVVFLVSGFNTDNAIIPKKEIFSSGVPKDGIPSLLKPSFIFSEEASFLNKKDQVIGVTINKKSKAYPIKILNWHEAVNDTLGGEPIVVTF